MTAGVLGLDCPGAVQFVPQGSDVCRDLLALYAEEIPGKLAQEFDALEKTGSADAARELRGAHGGADRAAVRKVAERTGELSPVPIAAN